MKSEFEASAERGALAEWRKGWPVVLAAGIGYGTGGGMILLLGSLFIKPMREALGWSTAAVTFAPIVTLTWALFYPAAGAIIDRYGSRRVALAGVLGLAFCALLMAVLPITRAGFYATAALMGIFASLAAVPTYTRAVASWFRRGIGLALGIVLSGSALIAIFATPLTGNMIAEHGWRAGFLTIAAIMLVLGLPVIALFFRERSAAATTPEQQRHGEAGAALGTALRDTRFWCYLLAFTIACIGLNGTLAHLMPMLAEKGLPLDRAISLGVLYAMAMTAGKLIGGFLLDRVWPFAVAAGMTTIAAAGSFALALAGPGETYALIAVLTFSIGMAQGAESDFVAFFTLRSFGMRAFATIVAVLAMVVTLGLAFGAWLYGVLFDLYGSYVVAGHIGAVCLLVSGVFVIVAGMIERASAGRQQVTS
jgi:predicted MFS family arabinose efflux permease